jgi:hypothetical protein
VGALARGAVVPQRLAFVLVSKLYRQMYAEYGDLPRQCACSAVDAVGAVDRNGEPRLFIAQPMPDLAMRIDGCPR